MVENKKPIESALRVADILTSLLKWFIPDLVRLRPL